MTDKAENENVETGQAADAKASPSQPPPDSSPSPAAPVELHAVIDRIEDGDIAVLTLEDEAQTQMEVPLAQLPKQAAAEGDHLRLKFDTDTVTGERTTLTGIEAAPERRAAAADRIARMQERLARLSGTEGKKDFNL